MRNAADTHCWRERCRGARLAERSGPLQGRLTRGAWGTPARSPRSLIRAPRQKLSQPSQSPVDSVTESGSEFGGEDVYAVHDEAAPLAVRDHIDCAQVLLDRDTARDVVLQSSQLMVTGHDILGDEPPAVEFADALVSDHLARCNSGKPVGEHLRVADDAPYVGCRRVDPGSTTIGRQTIGTRVAVMACGAGAQPEARRRLCAMRRVDQGALASASEIIVEALERGGTAKPVRGETYES
jgi:hypothetical protein